MAGRGAQGARWARCPPPAAYGFDYGRAALLLLSPARPLPAAASPPLCAWLPPPALPPLPPPLQALFRLQKVKESSWFWSPVRAEDAPGYHDLIRRPMDLATISDRLAGKGPPFSSPRDFLAHVQLVWDNCREVGWLVWWGRRAGERLGGGCRGGAGC